jgi:hypothetical protein
MVRYKIVRATIGGDKVKYRGKIVAVTPKHKVWRVGTGTKNVGLFKNKSAAKRYQSILKKRRR